VQKVIKNIIIFGGSGLIGKEIIYYLKKYKLNILNADLKKSNDKDISFIKCNVFKKEDIIKTKNHFIKKFGPIEGIINCFYPRSKNFGMSFEKINKKDFLGSIQAHMGSFFEINQIFCLYFKKVKKGKIINFSSIYGEFIPRFEIYKNVNFSMPMQYMVSKNGIIQITKFLAKLYLKDKISINCISPGGIYDNHNKKFLSKYAQFTSSNNMLNKKDINTTIKYLLDQDLKMTGQNLIIDEGFTL
tara:strand:- start:1694 stop:2425 length:732 start_codon:yes stop_codon:yes gene_type:complete